jgi:hypothetical protein
LTSVAGLLAYGETLHNSAIVAARFLHKATIGATSMMESRLVMRQFLRQSTALIWIMPPPCVAEAIPGLELLLGCAPAARRARRDSQRACLVRQKVANDTDCFACAPRSGQCQGSRQPRASFRRNLNGTSAKGAFEGAAMRRSGPSHRIPARLRRLTNPRQTAGQPLVHLRMASPNHSSGATTNSGARSQF